MQLLSQLATGRPRYYRIFSTFLFRELYIVSFIKNIISVVPVILVVSNSVLHYDKNHDDSEIYHTLDNQPKQPIAVQPTTLKEIIKNIQMAENKKTPCQT